MMTWTRASFSDAWAEGRRDFSGENLSGIDPSDFDLTGANLSKANLTGVNLVGAMGIWSIYAPGMSSDGRLLYANVRGGTLQFYAGCFAGSADALRTAIVNKHGDSARTRRYLAAVDFIVHDYELSQETAS